MSSPEQNFLEYILKNLLESPEELKISRKDDELGVLFEIKVSDQDMGKLIGKGGQTIKSLRTLIRMMGSRSEQRINIRIIEPES